MKVYHFTTLLLFLVACGESSSNNNVEIVPAKGLVRTIASAQCERIFSCCNNEDLKIVLAGQDELTQASCEKNLEKQLSAFFGPSIESAQKKEWITLKASKIASCGEAIGTQSCATISDDSTQIQRFEACRDAVVAKQESSGFCENNFECKSSFCVSGSEAGSCKTIPGAGSACESGTCGRGFFCDETDSCTPLGVQGDACLSNSNCLSQRCNIEDDTCEPEVGLCNG